MRRCNLTRGQALLGFVLGLLLTPPALRAQETTESPIIIDHYDELRRLVEGDSLTYFFTGNVRARREEIRMRSQRAIIYRQSQVADFQGDVHFWDNETEIYSDRLEYEETTEIVLATGHVQMIDRRDGSQVSADTIRYDRATGAAVARPRPQAVLLPTDTTDQQDPFHVWADVMRLESDSIGSEIVAVGKVLIERTDLTAVGDSLFYDDRAGIVALRVEPKVETEETFLTAQWIDVLLEDEEISALVARESARAIQKTDSIPERVPMAFDNVSPSSYLEGDSIHISFADEGIDWLVAEGNARSLNYSLESPSGPVETWSINYLLGHRLWLNFTGDTLRQVVASGGHRGIYRSEEVRVGGPERRESEPIPFPVLSVVALAPRRGTRNGAPLRRRNR